MIRLINFSLQRRNPLKEKSVELDMKRNFVNQLIENEIKFSTTEITINYVLAINYTLWIKM